MLKLFTTASLALLATCGSPATAQTVCGPSEAVSERLEVQYGETVQSVMLGDNVVIQVFANTETGTFTIVMTNPDGVACLMAAGQNYENVTQKEETY